jgi:hypothetical protein
MFRFDDLFPALWRRVAVETEAHAEFRDSVEMQIDRVSDGVSTTGAIS